MAMVFSVVLAPESLPCSDEHPAPLIIAQAKLMMESGKLMWVPFLKHWFLCTFFSLALENG